MASRYAETQSMVAVTCDSVISKAGQYRQPIVDNKASCELSAARFVKNGEVEQTLLSMVNSIGDDSVLSEENIQHFLQQQRDRVKLAAEMNVQNERGVNVLVDSVRTLKQEEIQKLDSGNTQEKEESDPGERLKEIYAQKRNEMEQLQLPMHQEEHYRDVCQQMGESAGPVGDDDIEMVHNGASQQSLNCPISRVLMENPVRSKLCGHCYSREGIEGLIAQSRQARRSCRCPYAGCTNKNVTEDQLEEDLLKKRQVKHELRRRQYEQSLKNSQADELVDTDDEE